MSAIRAIPLIFLILSCSSSSEDQGKLESIMQLEEGGDFRGIDMGDEVQQVLAREDRNVIYNMPDEITCRIPMDMVDSTFYEINYSFDEGELNHIELNLFPKDSNALDRLRTEFETYYNTFQAKDDKALSSLWTKRSARGKDVEIKMNDRSNAMDRPCLTITFKEQR